MKGQNEGRRIYKDYRQEHFQNGHREANYYSSVAVFARNLTIIHKILRKSKHFCSLPAVGII